MVRAVPPGDQEYFAARKLTGELVARLEAFLAGRETNPSLEAWARAVWGEAPEGPLRTNRVATSVLMNVRHAAARSFPGDASRPFLLRPADASEYLRMLRRGMLAAPARTVCGLSAPLQRFAAQLGLETERHVTDGLGWFEHLQFASPSSGRAFALSRPLDHPELHERLSTEVVVEPGGGPADVLRDLVETLGIDLADVFWFAEEFEGAALPKWALWRQDDNGHRAAIATFTGLRKGEAALRHYESLPHKQLYWLTEDDGHDRPHST